MAVFGALDRWLEAERGQWFNWVPVLFGAGVLGYFLLPAEPSFAAVLAPVAAALVLQALVREGTAGRAGVAALLCLATGFAVAKGRTEWVRAPILERQLTGVRVRGFVELVEPKPTRGQRITLRVSAIAGLADEALPRRVRIRTLATLAGLKPGDAVQIKATLAAPAEPSEPGAFDFARQAFYLGIGGVGYAMTAAVIDPDPPPAPWQIAVTAAIERARLAIGRAVVAALPGETGGIANALITGERGGISAATDAAYRDSGLYHVLSISGLHMVVMAGALFFAVRFAFAAIAPIALQYPIKKWAAVVAAFGALGYLLISGGSFATVRSYVMISILFLAIVLERPALALRNVAVAALFLLAIWPESLLDAGFQMSFAAVVALISVYEAIRAREARLGRADIDRGPVLRFVLFFGGILMSTVIATASVAPFAAYQFHTSQQYGALANLVALPVCDLVVMPAALATLLVMPFGLEAIPLWVAGLGIDAMTAIARFVAKLPGAVLAVPAIPTSAFAAMVCGGLWVLLWQTRARFLGLPVIAFGLALAPTLVRPDIIVGRDGTLVAARIDGGRLSALPAPRGLFELARWLEADGDGRPAKDAAAGARFRCDRVSCTAVLEGQRLAVPRHSAALADDCAHASIIVLVRPRPKGCAKPAVVIDRAALSREGAHAVYLRGGTIRVETVAAFRGDRPWVRRRETGPRGSAAGSAIVAGLRPSLLALIAAEAARLTGDAAPDPADEDDDAAIATGGTGRQPSAEIPPGPPAGADDQ